ncbi:hypothetical protein TWF569_003362 [Orbilia oligospora]|nr:hypothetical protein TWF569_003362 [Orbilia oligospora]
MLFSSLPPAILLLLSTSFAAAKPGDRTLSLFPAIPEVTEIAANSSLFAIIKATGAASTNYGINAKSQKPTETGTGTGTGTATATAIAAVSAGVDTNFYIDVTTFPNKNSQVLNYFTGAFPPTQVAEVTCSFEGTTSAFDVFRSHLCASTDDFPTDSIPDGLRRLKRKQFEDLRSTGTGGVYGGGSYHAALRIENIGLFWKNLRLSSMIA